jgi:two-component system cell cycle sensor histidine kinase/response regulator CckA
MQARVFEPFFTTKEAGKGTGLGLSVVFGIVKDSGGVISIESAPGQGATFTIDFPEVIASAAAPVQSAVTAVPAPAAGTILCVEDERPVRDVLHSMLTAQGCTVLTADNGEAALAMSRAHAGSIDLVISDLVMPGLPADEMIAILRAERPSIRVLCISGYSDRARLHPLLMRGDVPFLAKPFTATQLAAALVNALAPTEGSGMRLQS